MSGQAQYRIGFDIGGTFTDFVLIDTVSGKVETYKTLTTPGDPSRAILKGWNALLERVGLDGSDMASAIHATTLITNALIERKGARTALITTEGFRDILDTQREMRYDIYDLHSPPVRALVPRPLRWEAAERLDAFGNVVEELDEESLLEAIGEMQANDIEAVAVCFLHSYRNPEHEKRAAELLAGKLPGVSISLSSDVAPEIREYERMSTVTANAYVQPLAEGYLRKLEGDLQDAGFQDRLYLMLSSGGTTSREMAERFPIRTVESGPAAGTLAASFFGRKLGVKDLVSFDMGGTTAKMCLIRDGQPSMTNTFEIARVHRFKRGSGLPVLIPAIDLIEIGAGGGSIAWVDDMGLLKVGPESAGADPGPVCYGLGGDRPTVTDANLVLGYLNPDYFLGGRMSLDAAAAEESMRPLAGALDLTPLEAAHGIHQIVNQNMISATRVHIAERGEDPRELALLAFGGAGPIHAYAIARALKMPGFICPSSAGVASALGLLTAPVSFDLARTYTGTITPQTLPELDAVFEGLREEGRARLAEAGVPAGQMSFQLSADIRHKGQGHDIVVDLPWEKFGEVDIDTELRPHFYEIYETLYGHAHRHLDLEIMTCRLRATGPIPKIQLPHAEEPGTDLSRAEKGTRPAYVMEEKGLKEVPVYERSLLPAGTELAGPAIIEEEHSTTVMGPDCIGRIDDHANLIVELTN